jgi:hypothetical protein
MRPLAGIMLRSVLTLVAILVFIALTFCFGCSR